MRIKKYLAILICVLVTASLAYTGSIESAKYAYDWGRFTGNTAANVGVGYGVSKGLSALTKWTKANLAAKILASPVDEAVGGAGRGGSTAERLTHIFGKAEHNLGGLVKTFGSEEKAFLAVQDTANQALARGSLTVGRNGILPTGDLGNIIQVGGQSVRLIAGRVVDGVVSISSFSMKGLVP